MMKPATNEAVAQEAVTEINERLRKQRSLPLTTPQTEIVRKVIEEVAVAVQLGSVPR